MTGIDLMRARYLKPLKGYEETFGVKHRTLKKWIWVGKQVEPPDLPPFDEPAAMADWYRRRQKHPVPVKLLQLKMVASKSAPGNGAEENKKPIDLGALDISGLNSLRKARTYLAAIDVRLAEAYQNADEDAILRWQPSFDKALEAVRKAEIADREAAKQSGDLLPRGELLSDITELLELQRIMRSSMARRILARIPNLPHEFHDLLGEAIEKERDAEDQVLRRLPKLQSRKEALAMFNLEAAAA